MYHFLDCEIQNLTCISSKQLAEVSTEQPFVCMIFKESDDIKAKIIELTDSLLESSCKELVLCKLDLPFPLSCFEKSLEEELGKRGDLPFAVTYVDNVGEYIKRCLADTNTEFLYINSWESFDSKGWQWSVLPGWVDDVMHPRSEAVELGELSTITTPLGNIYLAGPSGSIPLYVVKQQPYRWLGETEEKKPMTIQVDDLYYASANLSYLPANTDCSLIFEGPELLFSCSDEYTWTKTCISSGYSLGIGIYDPENYWNERSDDPDEHTEYYITNSFCLNNSEQVQGTAPTQPSTRPVYTICTTGNGVPVVEFYIAWVQGKSPYHEDAIGCCTC